MQKRKPKKRVVLAVLACALLLLASAWYGLCASIYDQNINQRFESYEPLMLHVEDFDGLECTRYEFPSDKGQMLTGYWYSVGSG